MPRPAASCHAGDCSPIHPEPHLPPAACSSPPSPNHPPRPGPACRPLLPVGQILFDRRSNVQVQASLGELHRAIDRAVSLDDQRAGRDTGGGGGADSEEAQQGPGRALEARVAPAPAAADLVYVRRAAVRRGGRAKAGPAARGPASGPGHSAAQPLPRPTSPHRPPPHPSLPTPLPPSPPR